MFDKILIANRGEIACRIIKTAQAMGIKCVAVYSSADAGSKHVQMADEAYLIGGAASSESYLKIDKLIEVCKQSGAQAVHPGFGFVSENSSFAQALDDAGIAFIGPPKGAIEAMGDKITSKKLAAEAGVSTVPGYMGLIDDGDHAVRISEEIGYPVMIKASAGGGGKGMRVAYSSAEVHDAFSSAKNEASSSFGDDRIFIEKFIEQPRHIEIQILADKHGTCLYLGERECSIQRRHQKVVEEAPSPFLDETTRKAMGEQSVALAKAVDYCSAGTVEFIVDKDRNFYFLEMNTRLQVEHPVTEKITGLDLVEQMIRVAAGEKLSLSQEQVKLNGWAMECRLYAEDPLRGFLPSIGLLSDYQEPEENEQVRVDSGVREGDEVSMHYDPMIAKLVTYGADRNAAIDAMVGALDDYLVTGVNHNGAFLSQIMQHPRFVEGNLSTNFIAEEYPDGFNTDHLVPETPDAFLAALAVVAQLGEGAWAAAEGQTTYAFSVQCDSEGAKTLDIMRSTREVSFDWRPGQMRLRMTLDGQPKTFQIAKDGVTWTLSHAGKVMSLVVLNPREAELWEHMPEKVGLDSSKVLLAPMPGLLVSLAVKEGQEVQAGQELCRMEAMKMENILRAEKSATVAAIKAGVGDSLQVDQVIIEFETDS